MKPWCQGRLAVCVAVSISVACSALPAASQPPDGDTRKTIEKKLGELTKAIYALRAESTGKGNLSLLADDVLTDIEIYHQAASLVMRHNEFYQKETSAWTIEALDRGLERAKSAADDKFDWLKTRGKTVVRGYRSMVDNSVQPYAVTLPEEYEPGRKKWRLDVVLHGRDDKLNEVKFLHQLGDKAAPKEQQFIKIDIFGRGNNAYRWAGETDVVDALTTFELFEALIGREAIIDQRRHVLRGFSMGGAGTWHIGLHHPGNWCVIGPGAGFTTTHGYVKNLPENLGWPVEDCLRIYDAVPYAENAFNVPIVAYGGEKDAQLQAAKNIQAALATTNLPVKFELLVAPGLAHQFPAEWQKKAEEAYAPFIQKGRAEYPKHVRFVTYTLKYSNSDWVDILAMGQHYHKAVVDAEKNEDGFKVATTNVEILRLRVPKQDLHDMTVVIDGQEVTARPWGSKGGEYHVYLQRKDGKWTTTMPQRLRVEQTRQPRKTNGLQGPIDDAYTAPFLCVRATGKPWSERVDDYAEASLKRFQSEWAKYMRGDVRVKNDVDVTSEDITEKHLILFGDPGSNSMLANVLEGLPVQWSKDKLTIAGKSFVSRTHCPLLIYPNPLNPLRYVVINSGHTFHAEDFKGTNALLYPRFGDYAVLRLAEKGPALTVEQVELNGLFDDHWQVLAGK